MFDQFSISFLGENLDLSKNYVLWYHFTLFPLFGEFVLKKSIAFRISVVMLYYTERQIMHILKFFKSFHYFRISHYTGYFQAMKTEVAMNLYEFWLKTELPGFLQLA